jgi:hypothetical protein
MPGRSRARRSDRAAGRSRPAPAGTAGPVPHRRASMTDARSVPWRHLMAEPPKPAAAPLYLACTWGRHCLSRVLVAFGTSCVLLCPATGSAQTYPPIRISPSAWSPEGAPDGFSNPERGCDRNDGSVSSGGVSRQCQSHFCSAPVATKQTTWSGVPNGYRPIEIRVKWHAEVAGQIHYGSSTRATALIENNAGNGWVELGGKTWTNPTSGETYRPPNDWSSASINPASTNSGQIQVRATVRAELVGCPTPCGGYNPTSVYIIGRMWEIEIWVEPPSLTVSPNPVVRGQQAVFAVEGAPGAAISNWKYKTIEPGVGTIVRSANTGASTWSGQIVAAGEAEATVVLHEPGYLNGQTYQLKRELAVTPRDWFFPAAQSEPIRIRRFAAGSLDR